MQILIGADIVPTKSNLELFNAGNYNELLGDELYTVLQSADYRIFNLEVPLTDTLSPIDKNGPALIAPTSTVAGYKALSIDCLTIANNHIMDQGADGFFSTVKALDENGISHVGGGKNLDEAQKPLIIENEGKKIGVYACAEHEFSIASESSPGANPFDPLESLDHIADLKSKCDYVIVLYHGGKEHYRYPSPNLQTVCRKIVDKGANLVVCQHSHCIGCEEKYNDGTIVYGQGNFLFDYRQHPVWQTGLLIKITDGFKLEYIPIQRVGNSVRLAEKNDADTIMSDFFERGEQIKESGFIQAEYLKLSRQSIYNQVMAIEGANKLFFRVMNKITNDRFNKWYVDKKYRASKHVLKNFVECESLRELLLQGIDLIGE